MAFGTGWLSRSSMLPHRWGDCWSYFRPIGFQRVPTNTSVNPRIELPFDGRFDIKGFGASLDCFEHECINEIRNHAKLRPRQHSARPFLNLGCFGEGRCFFDRPE